VIAAFGGRVGLVQSEGLDQRVLTKRIRGTRNRGVNDHHVVFWGCGERGWPGKRGRLRGRGGACPAKMSFRGQKGLNSF